MRVAGLFSGIGGFEEGLRASGHEAELLCEVDPSAGSVLRNRFPGVPLSENICDLRALPGVDLVTAGFPCQDLSQAGRTAGIGGSNSALVGELFRLIDASARRPQWVLLENVPFMLHLNRGRAMSFVLHTLEDLGYRWAYRTMDSRAFGLPQRRQRIVILASKSKDPREVLLSRDEGEGKNRRTQNAPCGFYWTEGRTGVGWAVDSVPPLKGGSAVGIPSPPAIWFPEERYLGTPDIRDAERLQGFSANWTRLAETMGSSGRERWRLVGNAVSVPLSKWIGKSLDEPCPFDADRSYGLRGDDPWPSAAWGEKKRRFGVDISPFPVKTRRKGLRRFLNYPTKALSSRATLGFLSRALASSLRFQPGFLDDVAHHLEEVSKKGTLVNGPIECSSPTTCKFVEAAE